MTKKRRKSLTNVTQSVLKKKGKFTNSVRSNPFEVRINKKKYEVLGQRREKGESGLPGVSRNRAIEKRKKTLLKAYRERDKTNQLLDKRFGREDVPEEERELERFLLETKKRHKKTHHMFNLEDNEEELTHYGQSLGDHYNDIIITSDNEQEDVDATENHFGGFLRKKDSSETGFEPHKTRKEIMKEIAQKSKLHKYERQVEREQIEDLLDKVNNDWTQIRSLLHPASSAPPIREERDDYDRYLVELSGEPKGQAKDRLKTCEELDKEKEEEFEKYEAERKKRMLPSTFSGQYISADDDSMRTSRKKEDKRVLIHYNEDGKLVLPDGITSLTESLGEVVPLKKKVSFKEINNEKEEEKEEEESEGEEEKEDSGEEEMEGEEEESGEEEEESEEEEREEEEGEEEEREEEEELKDNNDDEEKEMSDEEDEMVIEDHDDNLQESTLEGIPNDVTDLVSILKDKSNEECSVIVGEMIDQLKSNKSMSKSFLSLLMEYCIHHTCDNPLIMNQLVKHLHELANVDPHYTLKCFQKRLKICFNRSRTCADNFPEMSDFVFFQLVAAIFPCSDFRHPVATPTLQLMSTVLLKSSSVSSISSVSRSLALCKVIVKYVSVSKRYVPELINYLINVLRCFYLESGPLTPPFTEKIKHHLSLHIYTVTDEECLLNPKREGAISLSTCSYVQLLTTNEINESNSNQIKLSLFKLTLDCICAVSQNWSQLSSYDVIFHPILTSINKLSLSFNSIDTIKSLMDSIKVTIEANISRPKPILQLLRCKPKSIIFFEPQFDLSYQPGKKKAPNKTLVEQMKLKHKHKRELKGAIREIRKDTKFLARQKLNEQLVKDAERKKKVKQIEGWLGEQQHDMKKERIRKRFKK